MQNTNRYCFFQISCISAPKNTSPHLSDALSFPLCSMTSFITPHLGLLADMAQERQLQMEDVEDASQVIDDWEDMEIEDNMENMVDIYLFFAYRNVQNSHYSTG